MNCIRLLSFICLCLLYHCYYCDTLVDNGIDEYTIRIHTLMGNKINYYTRGDDWEYKETRVSVSDIDTFGESHSLFYIIIVCEGVGGRGNTLYIKYPFPNPSLTYNHKYWIESLLHYIHPYIDTFIFILMFSSLY